MVVVATVAYIATGPIFGLVNVPDAEVSKYNVPQASSQQSIKQ